MRAYEIARDPSLKPIWDPKIPFPTIDKMKDLDILTHVAVERAVPEGYHFLLEATIARHKDKFFLGWANHRQREDGKNLDCLVRGKTSSDGFHWSEAETWMEAPLAGAESYNHPLIFSDGNTLYAYIASWYDLHPYMHVFTFNEETKKWDIHPESRVEGFVPFCAPQRLDDGNWIMSGSNFWWEAAVVISHGDDLTKWDMITIPKADNFLLLFPESSVIKRKDRLTLFCRSHVSYNTASISESYDNGRTWTSLAHSNYPMTDSMPYAGVLSTGQNYLITNGFEQGRALLTIALTDKGGEYFNRIFKIRHDMWPSRRLFGGYDDGMGSHVGTPTEWSYPKAIEHDGNLYVVYSQGKEDCCMSIIPIEVLQD